MKFRIVQDQQTSWRWVAGTTLAIAALCLAVGLLVYRRPALQTLTLCMKAGSNTSASSEGVKDSTGTSPVLRVYTVNLVAGSGPPTIKGGLWWAEFLLVSRLYNPDLSITAIVNREEADLASLQAVGPALQNASIRLMHLDDFNAPGSRGRRLMDSALPFFTQHYKLMFPKSGCANLTEPPDEGCVRSAEFHMSMLARFCWQADLANADGADYVMTMDADVMLTDDVRAALGHFFIGADVFSLFEWSSQVVIWKREALNAFCDAQFEVLDMLEKIDLQSLWNVFHAGGSGALMEWTDMGYLQAFLRLLRPDLKRVLLCGTPADASEELCRNVALMAAGMATFLGRRSWKYDAYDATCQHFEDHIEWRLGENGVLPELWSRWQYADHPTGQQQAEFEFLKPRQYGPPERVPMVHWQDACKGTGSAYVKKQYVQTGLLPLLKP